MRNKIQLISCILLLTSLLLLLLPINTDAQQPRFVVRTIYFKPIDAPSNNNINQLMEDVEQFYRNEMNRHGYFQEMFKLERDWKDDIVVHVVNGKHNSQHYSGNTYNKIRNELPNEYINQNNVHVFIIGGLEFIANSIWGVGWPFHSGTYGGNAVLGANIGPLLIPVVAHEMGHAFGLFHNISNKLGQSRGLYTNVIGNDFLMGPGNEKLALYEARWLSKHPLFNELRILNDIPEIGILLPLVEVEQNVIRLQINAKSVNNLHQIQVSIPNGVAIIGWSYPNFKKGIAKIDVARWNLLSGNSLTVQLMDANGNYSMKQIDYTMPPRHVVVEKPTKNPDLEEEKLTISTKNKLITSWARIKLLR